MSSDVKTTTFSPAETESVGDKLGYGKDSKERLPWEHYLINRPKKFQSKILLFFIIGNAKSCSNFLWI